MSDSNAQSRIHANLSQKSLQSITFQTKNTNTLQDILQTLKSQCLQNIGINFAMGLYFT